MRRVPYVIIGYRSLNTGQSHPADTIPKNYPVMTKKVVGAQASGTQTHPATSNVGTCDLPGHEVEIASMGHKPDTSCGHGPRDVECIPLRKFCHPSALMTHDDHEHYAEPQIIPYI